MEITCLFLALRSFHELDFPRLVVPLSGSSFAVPFSLTQVQKFSGNNEVLFLQSRLG